MLKVRQASTQSVASRRVDKDRMDGAFQAGGIPADSDDLAKPVIMTKKKENYEFSNDQKSGAP